LNLVSLLNNHVDEHQLLFPLNLSFSSRMALNQTKSLLLVNHLNFSDFHVGYHHKFVDPKSLRGINGKGLNAWPQTFTKRRVKIETFQHFQDDEFPKL